MGDVWTNRGSLINPSIEIASENSQEGNPCSELIIAMGLRTSGLNQTDLISMELEPWEPRFL